MVLVFALFSFFLFLFYLLTESSLVVRAPAEAVRRLRHRHADGRGHLKSGRTAREAVGETRAVLAELLHGLEGVVGALLLALLLVLQGLQDAGHLVLADAHGVVAHAERRGVGSVAVRAVLIRILLLLHAEVGEEIGAERHRDAVPQVGLAKDSLHLDVGEADVAVGLVLVVVKHLRPADAQLSKRGEGLAKHHLGAVVGPELVRRHDRLAPHELGEALVVEDGVPREELHGRVRVWRLLELVDDGLLAQGQLRQDLLLQEVGVGQEHLLLLLSLLLEGKLADLLQGDCGQESRVLERLQEGGVLGGKNIGERSHGVG